MIRTLTCIAASLLMVGVLYAEDKKPEATVEGAKEKSPDAVKKVNKADPEPVKKVAKEGIKKDDPEAVKKVAKEGVKKDDPEAAKKKQLKEGVKKESEGLSQKGRLTKIGADGSVVKLYLDGKEYEFLVTDNTLAVLKIAERDGKQVVVGIQLAHQAGPGKKGGEKKELSKKEGEKNASEKPKEKKPE